MNKKLLITSTTLAGLLAASAAFANPTVCTNSGLTRTVEVVYEMEGQDTPCEVIYNKQTEGTQSSLWRANNEAGYCEARAAEFIDKLEGWGWDCNAEAADAE